MVVPEHDDIATIVTSIETYNDKWESQLPLAKGEENTPWQVTTCFYCQSFFYILNAKCSKF